MDQAQWTWADIAIVMILVIVIARFSGVTYWRKPPRWSQRLDKHINQPTPANEI